MKNKWFLLAAAVLPLFFSGCGLSIYEDWKQSGGKAITGAGAVAGRDYITGLTPSDNSRKYFASISGDKQPIETVSRSDDRESKSGVRFVKNGGIVIPPGVTISFENRGYCMDPNLPAPKAGEEYQLVPATRLVPEDLQGIYKNLVTKASAGDENIQRNMQHLVWALRTAGTDAAFANNLTKEQKKILDRCSEYPGQFEEFNANAKANDKALKELLGKVDAVLNIKIGNVSYKASDLLDPDVGNKKINEHLNQLIGMSQHLPVEKSGFNFGEIQPGIYTDVKGTGPLQYRARIANSTSQPFIYYPTEYVGQVGSPTKNGAVASYAAADTSMRQRVTGGNPNDVKALSNSNKKSNDNDKSPNIKPSTFDDIKYLNPGYAIGEWMASFNPELHYDKSRQVGPKTEREAIAQGWKKMDDRQARYHRNPDDNKDEIYNKKYYKEYYREDGRKGSYEAIYDKDGNRVDNPRNIGTRNDSHPDGISGMAGHFFNDMLPYYFHGNTPNDPSPLSRRIFGPSLP